MNVALLNSFLSKIPPQAEIIGRDSGEFKKIAKKIVFSENSIVVSVDNMFFIFIPEWKLVTSVRKSDLKIVSEGHVFFFNADEASSKALTA